MVAETDRLWLQEDQNSQKFDRIVFCGEDSLPQLEATLEKYFPLLPFVTGNIPEGVEGETPSADGLLGEVSGENLMVEKTADQGGPEGENPNEKELEGEIPGDGGGGDKGGKFLSDFDEEKVLEIGATKPVVQENRATKSAVQETGATKPAVEEVIDLDAITLELDNLQRAPQESLVELTVSETSRDLDTLEKVAQEKLVELGGSEANEELDAQTK